MSVGQVIRSLFEWPRVAFWFIAMPTPSTALGQDLIVSGRVGVEEGLSHSSVTALQADSRGFLWIGTVDGLNRFDGYEMSVFHSEPDARSLIDNYVNLETILEDGRGNLWVGTRNGLSRYDPVTAQFTDFRQLASDPCSLADNYVSALFEAGDGTLWVGTAAGIQSYRNETSCFHSAPTRSYQRDATDSALTSSLLEDHRGVLWIGTASGLRWLRSQEPGLVAGRLAANDSRNLAAVLDHASIYDMVEDAEGNLWVATFGEGLFRIAPSRQRIDRYIHDQDDTESLPDERLMDVLIDSSGTVWLGTYENGLASLDPRTGRVTRFEANPHDMNSLADHRVTSLAEDGNGLLWVGTWGGVSRLLPRSAFSVLTSEEGEVSSLSHPEVTAVRFGSDGMLWIGTANGGVNRVNLASGEVNRLPFDATSPTSNRISSILLDSRGSVWIGTFTGITRIDPGGTQERFRHRTDDPTSLGSDHVYSIVEDDSQRVWVGTNGGGLQRFDHASGRFTRFTNDSADPASLSGNRVWPILVDQEGVLWIGTVDNGLNRFDGTGHFTRYRHDPSDPSSISNDRVVTIHEDARGALWVGTMGGLDRLDRRTGTFSRYSLEDGLPDHNVSCMLTDLDGYLWVSTAGGLTRFDHRTDVFRRFSLDGDQPAGRFTTNACAPDSEGRMHFGSSNGLVSFDPVSLAEEDSEPPVALVGFELFNEPAALDTSVTYARRITLNHDQNFVGFRYSALDFRSPLSNRYAYQLMGIDPNWVQAGTRRIASYPNLDPGTYTFRVRASNGRGIWNDRGASIELTIEYPWWESWWAYGLYLAIFAIVVGGYVRWWQARARQKQLQQRAERLEEINQTKSRFFGDISHDFRTSLTLIIGPLRDILTGKHGKLSAPLRQMHDLMLASSVGFERLINQLLELTKLEAKELSLVATRVDLNRFVPEVAELFVPLAMSRGIELDFYIPDGELHVFADQDKFMKILTNLLSNALEVTPEGGQVNVAVQESEEWATISVSDTGPGISESEQEQIFKRYYTSKPSGESEGRYRGGHGIGLALARELVELHHGELDLATHVGEGSSFTVLLPLGNAHLDAAQIVKQAAQDGLPARLALPYLEAGAVPILAPIDRESSGSTDQATILVVDDHVGIRDYVRMVLGRTYQVIEASDGSSGLKRATVDLPDLIIADIVMPRMDGVTMLNKLRESPPTDCIPVIFLTARAAIEDKLRGLGAGAIGYITKPFDSEELIGQVGSLLDYRSRLKNLLLEISAPPATAPRAEPELGRRTREIVLKRLETNETLSMTELARELGMSYSSLHARFKAELDTRPRDFERAVRLERAGELLDAGETNIALVAFAVGFESHSNFTKRFKEHFGCTPSHYLKRTK